MVLTGDLIADTDAPYPEDLGPGDRGIESGRSSTPTPGCFTPHNQPYVASTTKAGISAYPLHPSNTLESFSHLEEDASISHHHLSRHSNPRVDSGQLTPFTIRLRYISGLFPVQSMERHSGLVQPANLRSATLTDGDTSNTFYDHRRERRRIISMQSPPWSLHSTGSSQERAILEFIASRNGAYPFLTRVTVERSSASGGDPHIQLENYPTSLAHPQVAARFRLLPGSGNSAVQSLRLLAAELCLAVLFLHRNGIVHRDIKPTNIMISEDGHATLGGFSTARFVHLPHLTSQDRFRQPFTSDADRPNYRLVALQSDGNAYLDLADTNHLSEFLMRADWRSLGKSLYGVITGGVLSEDPKILQTQVKTIKEANVQLLHFLQSLLIRNPTAQLCGEDALSHPFFDTVRDLWDEIEELRHPPCRHPPSLSFSSHFHSPAKDPGNPCYALRPRKPSCDTLSTGSTSFPVARGFNLSTISLMPPFSPERCKEALEVGLPTTPIFEDTDNFTDYHPVSYDTESSMIHQEILLSSNHFTPNSGMNTSSSIVEPCVSTAHIIRFFQHHGSKPTLKEETENGEYGHCDIVLDSTERSFNDSGLDFPLGETPESWGPRKDDRMRKPERLRLVSVRDEVTPASQPTVNGLLSPISLVLSQRSATPPAEKTQKRLDWTVDQEIAITLLCARMEKAEPERRAKQRRFGRLQLIAKASARAFSAVKRRTSNILRGGRPGVFKD